MRIQLYTLLLTAGAAVSLCEAAETIDLGDRDDRTGAYERRGNDDGSRGADRGRGRSYSYKELYGDGRGRRRSNRELNGVRNADPDGRSGPDYGQKQREPYRSNRHKSDFKYGGDSMRDSHLSHRSYRGRGSAYGSGRDRRTFGKDPKDKRRSRR